MNNLKYDFNNEGSEIFVMNLKPQETRKKFAFKEVSF